MKASSSMMVKVASVLQEARKLLVIGHVSPDGDSLGSSIALVRLLRQVGKEAHVACFDRIQPRYEYLLRFSSMITMVEQIPQDVDHVIVLDCSDVLRTGLPVEFISTHSFINIDHHASNNGSLGLAWVDVSAGAVGQQIIGLIDYAGWHVDADTATCLFTSLATDTGFFRHSNTTPALLRDAARLLEWGADARLVTENAIERKSLGELCLIRHALGTLSLHEANRIALIEVSLEMAQHCGVQADEVEEMVEFARAVPGTEVAILLKEMATSVTKVSFRSKGQIDVSKIAMRIGGGGHRVAAGATLPVDIKVARQEILQLVAQVLNIG